MCSLEQFGSHHRESQLVKFPIIGSEPNARAGFCVLVDSHLGVADSTLSVHQ